MNHCTIDLLFDWFGISCLTTDNFSFHLQNRLIQSSQTGGHLYSDTSPFSIPCFFTSLRPPSVSSSSESSTKAWFVLPRCLGVPPSKNKEVFKSVNDATAFGRVTFCRMAFSRVQLAKGQSETALSKRFEQNYK
jgi:hypothetical protein